MNVRRKEIETEKEDHEGFCFTCLWVSRVFSLAISCCSSSLNAPLVISHGHSLVIKAYHLMSVEVFLSSFIRCYSYVSLVFFPIAYFCVSCLRMRMCLKWIPPPTFYPRHSFCRDFLSVLFSPLLCSSLFLFDRLKASVFSLFSPRLTFLLLCFSLISPWIFDSIFWEFPCSFFSSFKQLFDVDLNLSSLYWNHRTDITL